MNRRKVLAIVVAVATFMGSVPAMAASFTDINNVPWEGAKTYINSVADAGLMIGDYDNKGNIVFRARDGVSYCETMQLVYTLAQKTTGESVTSTVQNKWTTVMSGYKIPDWAQPAVAYGLENGIVTISDIPGFVNASGSATVRATRQDVAIMFGRALKDFGTLNSNPVLKYNDRASVSSTAVAYVDLLTNLNILTGDDLGNFNPKNSINRAEMAAMVLRTFELMKTGQTKSVNGTVTEVTSYGTSTILSIYDGKTTVALSGTEATPVLEGSSRILLSTVKKDDVVLVSYSGTTLQSVLITSRGTTTNTTQSKAEEVKGTFVSSTDYSIRIRVNSSNKTYEFLDDDYRSVNFYQDGKTVTYSRFERDADTTSTIVLTLDKNGYVTKADMTNVLSGTFVSITSTDIRLRVDGSNKTYDFKNSKSGDVTFKVSGTTKTYNQFRTAASNGSKVEFTLNSDDEVVEINLVEGETTGTFVQISTSALRLKVDGSNVNYNYPDDDYRETDFYINNSLKSYQDFKKTAESGDEITIELDKDDCLSKVYLGTNSSSGDAEGKLTKIYSSRITVDGKTYYFNKDDIDQCNISITDGTSNSKITDYDDLKDAFNDDKIIYGIVTLNSSDKITKLEGYVMEVRGEMTGLLTDKSGNGNYVRLRGEDTRSTFTYYFNESDVNVSMDSNYSNSMTGLKNAHNSNDVDKIYVILTINKNGYIEKIDGNCN